MSGGGGMTNMGGNNQFLGMNQGNSYGQNYNPYGGGYSKAFGGNPYGRNSPAFGVTTYGRGGMPSSPDAPWNGMAYAGGSPTFNETGRGATLPPQSSGMHPMESPAAPTQSLDGSQFMQNSQQSQGKIGYQEARLQDAQRLANPMQNPMQNQYQSMFSNMMSLGNQYGASQPPAQQQQAGKIGYQGQPGVGPPTTTGGQVDNAQTIRDAEARTGVTMAEIQANPRHPQAWAFMEAMNQAGRNQLMAQPAPEGRYPDGTPMSQGQWQNNRNQRNAAVQAAGNFLLGKSYPYSNPYGVSYSGGLDVMPQQRYSSW